MKTKKGQETRNHIIQAAEQLFMEKNVSKVTISEIGQRAGVAKGTFYLYFESKDDLVWNFMDYKFGHADKWMKGILIKGYSDEDLYDIVDYIVSFAKKNIVILNGCSFFLFVIFDAWLILTLSIYLLQLA
ncbi:TetR/AcrR family transcriptional regulator [Natronincola peptidivorans]|nr:TetR/AcrR family transcriptional regulator [Natronincola peptidivorans]